MRMTRCARSVNRFDIKCLLGECPDFPIYGQYARTALRNQGGILSTPFYIFWSVNLFTDILILCNTDSWHNAGGGAILRKSQEGCHENRADRARRSASRARLRGRRFP